MWNDVYNRYSTKQRIEEDTVPLLQKEEKVSSRRAETEKDPVKIGTSHTWDLREKTHDQRRTIKGMITDQGIERSSRFRNDRNTYESRDDDRNLKARFGSYSFNVSTSEIVSVLRSMGDKVRWPKEMRSNPNRRNPDHWCEFHNDHGHKTADCRFLQSEVDHLLKQGYLTELFSEKGKQPYMKNRQEPPKAPSPKRTVNVICGGKDINGISYTAANKISKVTITQGKRMRHVIEEESITFDDADADGVLTPHNDALGRTDVDSRPDTIQEPEENEIIKTTIEELEPVVLFAQWPDKKVYIGANLSQGMRGIPLEVMTHKLNEDLLYPPVKQKKRKQGTFKNQVIQEVFQKLLKIGSIREVKNPNWLANTVVVPKKNGKFLGFPISIRGIEVNPAQINAIEEMPDMLSSKKEVQRLTGRIAALGRFISKSSEKCFKFFSALKKQDHFEWNEECQQALRNLKTYLSNPPLLAKPKAKERLLIYLAISEVAVSAVLVREDQGKQSPIYYVSKSLLDAETRYPQLEKLSLALIMASRKLRPYFQCHPIAVVTAYLLCNILHKHELLADALANLASATDVASNENASVIHLFHSVLDLDRNEYRTVPEDKRKAHALRKKAVRYCLKQGNLYRKMFGGPLARCLGPSQTEYVMREIHEGHCENHAGGLSLVRTLIRAGYYRPKMEEEAERLVAKCDKCQRYETLIPVEIGEPSTRFTQATEESNDEEMRVNLGLLEGRRETALIRMTSQKQVIERL
ncbi:uncharacterized protein [Nicotiana sylvestris]|uniref:uncharacterized protein n=1 Tax=Nicotiana sylvestris TaxID=4096 RepID=UPI00388CA35F